MNFERCNPYVRYCDIIKDDNATRTSKKSYDNCMIYILSGTADVHIENESYTLHHGDVLIWRAGMSYRITMPEAKSSYVQINFDYTEHKRNAFRFKIDADLPENFDINKITDYTSFDDLEIFNSCVHSSHKNIMEEDFLLLYSDFKVKRNCLDMRLKSRISLILCEIANEYLYSNGQKTPNLINEILQYINDNCTNSDMTNEDIAAKFGFHPRHINRLVSQKVGYSLHRYVIVKRIQKACDLLIQSKAPISDIAASAGFNNVYHFSRYFKQIMGLSPIKYRQHNTGDNRK